MLLHPQVTFLLNLGSTSKASGSARLWRRGLGKSAVDTCDAPARVNANLFQGLP